VFANRFQIRLRRGHRKEGSPVNDLGRQVAVTDERIVGFLEMSPGAGPAIVAGLGDDRSADRVEKDVLSSRDEMTLVQRAGEEPSLPEKTPPILPEVDAHRIFPVSLTQALGETVHSPGDRDQVHVVFHEAIGPKIDARIRPVLAEKMKVESPILILEKHGLAAITPLDDMVGITWHDHSRKPAHNHLLLFFIAIHGSLRTREPRPPALHTRRTIDAPPDYQ
jgi:hypothetical protein